MVIQLIVCMFMLIRINEFCEPGIWTRFLLVAHETIPQIIIESNALPLKKNYLTRKPGEAPSVLKFVPILLYGTQNSGEVEMYE